MKKSRFTEEHIGVTLADIDPDDKPVDDVSRVHEVSEPVSAAGGTGLGGWARCDGGV